MLVLRSARCPVVSHPQFRQMYNCLTITGTLSPPESAGEKKRVSGRQLFMNQTSAPDALFMILINVLHGHFCFWQDVQLLHNLSSYCHQLPTGMLWPAASCLIPQKYFFHSDFLPSLSMRYQKLLYLAVFVIFLPCRLLAWGMPAMPWLPGWP